MIPWVIMRDGIFAEANDISLRDLLRCVTESGIVAGVHHFVDLWARDSLFAALGALAAGEDALVKKTLETFLGFQRDDGLVPYRILRSPTTIGKYCGIPRYFSSPKPDFRSHQSGGTVPDGGLMTIIVSERYVSKTKDMVFLKQQYPRLQSAFYWYKVKYREGLIREWFLCEWADAVLKVGKTFYTNILYWRALVAMERIAGFAGDTASGRMFEKQQKKIALEIRKQFWNGRFFSDWIDYKRHDYLSSHGNLLAIIFGFSSGDETRKILAELVKRNDAGWTLQTNDPKYPWWRIPLGVFFINMQDYHNRGCLWMQTGILHALALEKNGQHTDAVSRLKRVAEKILEFRHVFEVFEPDGHPVNRRFYHSEGPFAWSAGLFILAYHHVVQKTPFMHI